MAPECGQPTCHDPVAAGSCIRNDRAVTLTLTHAWRAEAACRGMPSRLWIADAYGENYREARRICAACTVRRHCAAYTLHLLHEGARLQGVWAGVVVHEPSRRHAITALTAITDEQTAGPTCQGGHP